MVELSKCLRARIEAAFPILLGTILVSSPCATGGLAAPSESALPSLFTGFEPDTDNPYGRINPQAPSAVRDYAFMVGEWACDERLRRDGQWTSFPSRMTGRFYLNGFGIINFTWTPDSASSMTYQYDEAEGVWKITNTGAPRAAHSVWRGAREGDERVARTTATGADGKPGKLRITFHDISQTAFGWRLEALTAGEPFLIRQKTCQRR